MAKKTLFFLMVLLLTTIDINAGGISKVKMYLVNYQARYSIVPNISNIKKHHEYYIEIKESDVSDLFDSYSECKDFLSSPDTIVYKYNSCIACVEFCFKWRKLTVFFKENGTYYFKGKWYEFNNELFYMLFSSLSNIVPIETLNNAKMNIESQAPR